MASPLAGLETDIENQHRRCRSRPLYQRRKRGHLRGDYAGTDEKAPPCFLSLWVCFVKRAEILQKQGAWFRHYGTAYARPAGDFEIPSASPGPGGKYRYRSYPHEAAAGLRRIPGGRCMDEKGCRHAGPGRPEKGHRLPAGNGQIALECLVSRCIALLPDLPGLGGNRETAKGSQRRSVSPSVRGSVDTERIRSGGLPFPVPAAKGRRPGKKVC